MESVATPAVDVSGIGKLLAVAGALLQLCPVLGAVGTYIGLSRAYQRVQESTTGIGDPEQTSTAIGEVFLMGFGGLVLGIVGLVLLTFALLKYCYRARWFFWFLIVYGTLVLVLFPIGTAIGVFFIGCCIERRREFLPPRPGNPGLED